MAIVNSVKGFVVNQVNPKFKEYNKPFFLAITVAIPTAVLTLMLFYIMMNNCTQETKIAPMAKDLQDKIDKAKCASQTFYTYIFQEQDGTYGSYYSPCRVDGATYCDDAQDVFPNAASCSNNGAFMAEVRVCPAPMSTFGAALGYAGFIELAITVAFVFVLMRCGILQGGPDGYMGQMIQEIVANKGTGKEIGGHVMGV